MAESSVMAGGQARELAQALLAALGIDWQNRNVRRVTLVLDAEELATVYVEEYPSAGRFVDLKDGFEKILPRLKPQVVIKGGEGASDADAGG